jgi:hypothetical protein
LSALEPLFNEAGLTLQTTQKNRIVLCKLVEGTPSCNAIMEDYIFLGATDSMNDEISERMIKCITRFISEAASDDDPQEVNSDNMRSWQDGKRTYGKIFVMNEDVNSVVQEYADAL